MPPEYAVPIEAWRELIARRRRCEEVCSKHHYILKSIIANNPYSVAI